MHARLSVATCTLAALFCHLSVLQNPVLGQALAVASSQPVVADLALQKGGVLSGQVVSGQGSAVANAEVSVLLRGKSIVSGQTSAGGEFHFAGLRPGVYDVVTPGGHQQYRVWAPGTAPPNAVPVARIVDGSSQTQLVQYWGPPAYRPRGRGGPSMAPLIGVGLAAAAIGGIVAIIEDDDNTPPGS